MSEKDEQVDKKIIWQSHIDNARNQLKRLEKERIMFADYQKKNKERIVSELAQNLEKDGMPEFMIAGYVIKMLGGYAITADYIKRIVKKKYRVPEESSVEDLENPEIESNTIPEQRIIAVDASTGQEQEEENFDKIKRPNVITDPDRIRSLEM
jgi:hypothetical protein